MLRDKDMALKIAEAWRELHDMGSPVEVIGVSEGVTAQLPACPICCKARSYAHNTWQARTCKRRGLQVSCVSCPNPTYSPPPQFHDPAGPASLPACCRCTPARSIPHTFLTASALRSRQVG